MLPGPGVSPPGPGGPPQGSSQRLPVEPEAHVNHAFFPQGPLQQHTGQHTNNDSGNELKRNLDLEGTEIFNFIHS